MSAFKYCYFILLPLLTRTVLCHFDEDREPSNEGYHRDESLAQEKLKASSLGRLFKILTYQGPGENQPKWLQDTQEKTGLPNTGSSGRFNRFNATSSLKRDVLQSFRSGFYQYPPVQTNADINQPLADSSGLVLTSRDQFTAPQSPFIHHGGLSSPQGPGYDVERIVSPHGPAIDPGKVNAHLGPSINPRGEIAPEASDIDPNGIINTHGSSVKFSALINPQERGLWVDSRDQYGQNFDNLCGKRGGQQNIPPIGASRMESIFSDGNEGSQGLDYGIFPRGGNFLKTPSNGEPNSEEKSSSDTLIKWNNNITAEKPQKSGVGTDFLSNSKERDPVLSSKLQDLTDPQIKDTAHPTELSPSVEAMSRWNANPSANIHAKASVSNSFLQGSTGGEHRDVQEAVRPPVLGLGGQNEENVKAVSSWDSTYPISVGKAPVSDFILQNSTGEERLEALRTPMFQTELPNEDSADASNGWDSTNPNSGVNAHSTVFDYHNQNEHLQVQEDASVPKLEWGPSKVDSAGTMSRWNSANVSSSISEKVSLIGDSQSAELNNDSTEDPFTGTTPGLNLLGQVPVPKADSEFEREVVSAGQDDHTSILGLFKHPIIVVEKSEDSGLTVPPAWAKNGTSSPKDSFIRDLVFDLMALGQVKNNSAAVGVRN